MQWLAYKKATFAPYSKFEIILIFATGHSSYREMVVSVSNGHSCISVLVFFIPYLFISLNFQSETNQNKILIYHPLSWQQMLTSNNPAPNRSLDKD